MLDEAQKPQVTAYANPDTNASIGTMTVRRRLVYAYLITSYTTVLLGLIAIKMFDPFWLGNIGAGMWLCVPAAPIVCVFLMPHLPFLILAPIVDRSMGETLLVMLIFALIIGTFSISFVILGRGNIRKLNPPPPPSRTSRRFGLSLAIGSCILPAAAIQIPFALASPHPHIEPLFLHIYELILSINILLAVVALCGMYRWGYDKIWAFGISGMALSMFLFDMASYLR